MDVVSTGMSTSISMPTTVGTHSIVFYNEDMTDFVINTDGTYGQIILTLLSVLKNKDGNEWINNDLLI
jgi:hypothetical protein